MRRTPIRGGHLKSFQVHTEKRPNSMGLDGTVVVLWNPATGAGAEVWPALGFNLYRWQTGWKGQTLDLVYSDPLFFAGARPTRSGIPILFPFPNRIRDGRYTWQGKEYQLPLNDSAKTSAIHGFTSSRPWRVIDKGADNGRAWVTGEFHAAVDAPDTRDLWPADYRIRLTYRLVDRGLQIEAEVQNPDSKPLPFGLGYHPYFRVPFVTGRSEEDYWVDCPARQAWQLVDNLPTGEQREVHEADDLRAGRWFAGLSLDDVYTALEGSPDSEGLYRRAGLRQASDNVGLEVWTSRAFREMVIFTPPHRQAICLEPYTCATDAINLQQRGITAGLNVLEPGGEWRGVVELRAPTVSVSEGAT
jgi:aldose 1-epimerase